MRRLTWFIGGIITGGTAVGVGSRTVKRRVRRTIVRTTDRLSPRSIGQDVSGRVRRRVRTLSDAVAEGRQAMRWREDELRARRDGRLATLDEHIGPDDEVFVDGRPVRPGQVVVMRHPR